MTTPPGWLPDPHGRYELRYHNGVEWTADVSRDGQRFVDPLGRRRAGGNGAAIASLVLGIVAITFGWLPFLFVVGAICGILAIVLGRRARRSAADAPTGDARRGAATAGMITGATGLAACALGVALTGAVIDEVDRFRRPEPHTATIDDCTVERGPDGTSTATARGVIVNDGDDTGDFTVTVQFVRPGTRSAQRTAVVALDDVAPGGSAGFEVGRAVRLDDVECRIGEVTGPWPFGIRLAALG